MTDEEKELMKIGAEAALKPVSNLVERLFGGAVDQIGGTWEDSLKARRQIRFIKLMQKVNECIKQAGFEPLQLRDALSIPFVEAASLEDDETLRAKWANLLANAADPRAVTPVLPIFSTFLRDMGSKEAVFLDALYIRAAAAAERAAVTKNVSQQIFTMEELKQLYFTLGYAKTDFYEASYGRQDTSHFVEDQQSFHLMFDVIRRHDIIRQEVVSPRDMGQMSTRTQLQRAYHFSDLGAAFVKACQPPKAA